MAKVTAPLLSLDARGSIGNALDFSNYRGVLRVRKKCKPKLRPDPRTSRQLTAREIFQTAVQTWQNFTLEQKSVWDKKQYPMHMSGFNRFMHFYLNGHYTHGQGYRHLPFVLNEAQENF